jgi:D-beta-D-heptose 7-phosphate kinase/D-beta-D-heptose 1-phosphate adenosyltransferase
VTRNDLTVGGAGNVARNIAASAPAAFSSVSSARIEASRTLMRALAAEPLIEPHLVVDPARPTTRKVRFVSEHHSTHLLRADWELPEVLNAPDREGPDRSRAWRRCRGPRASCCPTMPKAR